MTRPHRASLLDIVSGVALATLFLASGQPTSAGIFGASKDDVAIKVAALPTEPDRTLFPYSAIYPLGLDFGPDGSRIAVESQSGKIQIWDWRNKRVERTVELPHGGNALGATNPLLYSSDGQFLTACEVTGAGDVVVRIWETATWSIAKDIAAGTGIESRGSCTGMGFVPGGKQFVRTARTDGASGNYLIVYAVGTWQPLWGVQIKGFSPASMAISPNGEQVAIAGTILVTPADVIDPLQRSI
jgi:hypothetical protein